MSLVLSGTSGDTGELVPGFDHTDTFSEVSTWLQVIAPVSNLVLVLVLLCCFRCRTTARPTFQTQVLELPSGAIVSVRHGTQ